MRRSRNFQLTLNNPNGDEKNKVKAIICEYCIYCREVAPTTGTEHIHAFVHYKHPRSWKNLKELLPAAHIEICKGTVEQNISYVKKHGEWAEYGEKPQQGKRSDLEALTDLINDGADLIKIADEMPSMIIKYSKGIEKLMAIRMKHRKEGPKVSWFWGPTGVGKTRTACATGHGSYYIKDHTQWWDGYHQEKTIVIDDFDLLPSGKPCWPFRDLLRLLDRYPYAGQYKGGYIPINSREIIITSEFPPQHFWTDSQLAQVKRRIRESGGEVVHMHPPLMARTQSIELDDIINSQPDTDEPSCSKD